MLTGPDVLAVPGLLPDALGEGVAAALPEQTPPAPWRSRIETTFWTFRSTPASATLVPAPFRAGAPLGAAAFIDYLDGAVGPYREILATPRCVRAPGLAPLCGHVPFIAVDSIASVQGGRSHWALPKLDAEFSGAFAGGGELAGTGHGWSVRARVRPFGPWLPLRGGAPCAQPWPDGTVRSFASSFRGTFRAAVLEVSVGGAPELASVLPGGRHLGAVFRGTVTVGAPVIRG